MLPLKLLIKIFKTYNGGKIGSAQCKSSVMLAALKTPGVTKIKAKKLEITLNCYLKPWVFQ